ncbi:MAG: hypothetical protein GY862_26015, partial [Gammaproteobacteria bacterium]|nr:hypothetical protein [Gammaproteobacteria bacterium]
PFGLHDKKKFFSFHQSALAQILKGNSELKDTDFYLARKNRPFLIVTGTLFTRNSAGLDQRYLFEATPLYAGIRKRFTLEAAEAEDDLPNKRVIGGGYVEAFGYDSYAPQQKRRLLSNGRWQVRLKGKWSRGDRRSNKRYRFTLSDVMGMSSASPLITLAAKGIPDPVFPEFRHWAVDRERIINDKALINEAAELKHGDGADIDNLAILPLLARNIENILVFINTRVRFLPPPTGCDTVPAQTMVDDLISLFRRTQKLKHNVVFANGEKELKNICRKFKAQRNKREPLVYCKRYQVVENIRQAIRPRNYTPSICWVYLDRAEQWIEKIPRTGKLTRKLILRQRPFDTFPHYKTFAEQGVTAIDLDRERVHALSNLAAWTVFKGAKDIADGLKGASLSISKRPDPFE